ncbi:HIRA-interacting protein 3 isoform X2 [Sphaeramia orbicularis]|uniref:HIRA-interacting protein 3 isoform X2 n=1 Tax=Sphaeramia orbicularis TaxID=375764 RepID=UPI00117D7982|nr:HIRA-interacting protein 3 isoform X2 [Sphaeramia orbicularis]
MKVSEKESQTIRKFVRRQLRDEPDLSTLTIGILKRRYLEYVGHESLSSEAKHFMKRVVEEELVKMQDNDCNGSDSEVKVPQNKRKREEESDGVVTESEDESRAKKSRRVSNSSSESEDEKENKTASESSEDEEQIKAGSGGAKKKAETTKKKTNKATERQISSDDSSDEETKEAQMDDGLKENSASPKEPTRKKDNTVNNGKRKSSKTSEDESDSDSKSERSAKRDSNESSDDDDDDDDNNEKERVTVEKRDEDSDSSSLPSIEDDEEADKPKKEVKKKKKKEKKTKAVTKQEKTKSERDGTKAVARLKHYITLCGVRRNYKKLFENCHSVHSQVAVLKKELEDLGVEGHPSIQKCKKIRMKRERAQEIAELDVNNIIFSQGRPKRRGVLNEQQKSPSSTYQRTLSSGSDSDQENKTHKTQRRTTDWSSLQGIISDDADSD